jgi:hypothetical protein
MLGSRSLDCLKITSSHLNGRLQLTIQRWRRYTVARDARAINTLCTVN